MSTRFKFSVERPQGSGRGLRSVESLLSGAQAHVDVGWSTRWTDPDTVEVAAINVLGGTKDGRPHPPERDAITPAVRDNAKKRARAIGKLLRSARMFPNPGSVVAQELRKHAKVEAEWLREAVWDFDDPPNAESTIAQKGEDNPLIRGISGGRIVNGVGAEVDSL